jgi:hypothetical protein
MWSHRRQSVPQSEAVPPFTAPPFLDPHPETPIQRAVTASPFIDGTDSSALLTEEVNGESIQPVKDHPQAPEPRTIKYIDDVVLTSFSHYFGQS